MIKELKKIIAKEIRKNDKSNIYRKKIGTNSDKINETALGALSY